MFAYDEIRRAVAAGNIPATIDDISLPELSRPGRVGVGRDGAGAFIFVGPGQAAADALIGKNYRFEPWTSLIDGSSNLLLSDVCVLRFRPDEADEHITDAVVAIFFGLAETAASASSSLGRAIAEMTHLFEAALVSMVSREIELGLAGELLVILESAQPSAMAARWHTDSNAQFDFSAQGERLEVKTASGPEREHWFSSGQLASIPGVCTTFVSVVLPDVEVGATVASLFTKTATMPIDVRSHVRAVILDTARTPPELLTSVIFDEDAGRASLRHIPPAAIPAPLPIPGVLRIRWEAALSPLTEPPSSGCAFLSLLGY